MSPKFQTWGGREGTPRFWTWAWKGAEGPQSSRIRAARRIPEVMGLGLEEADNMVPKFWTRIRVVTGILESRGWGPHIPKLRRALGAPLLTRVGTRS